MLEMSRHLQWQYPVSRWPSWADVARPRPNINHLSFQDVVPVLGPAAQLLEKLCQGRWEQSMQSTRRSIEEHVRGTPGFRQHPEPVPRGRWGLGVRALELPAEQELQLAQGPSSGHGQLLGALGHCLA